MDKRLETMAYLDDLSNHKMDEGRVGKKDVQELKEILASSGISLAITEVEGRIYEEWRDRVIIEYFVQKFEGTFPEKGKVEVNFRAGRTMGDVYLFNLSSEEEERIIAVFSRWFGVPPFQNFFLTTPKRSVHSFKNGQWKYLVKKIMAEQEQLSRESFHGEHE